MATLDDVEMNPIGSPKVSRVHFNERVTVVEMSSDEDSDPSSDTPPSRTSPPDPLPLNMRDAAALDASLDASERHAAYASALLYAARTLETRRGREQHSSSLVVQEMEQEQQQLQQKRSKSISPPPERSQSVSPTLPIKSFDPRLSPRTHRYETPADRNKWSEDGTSFLDPIYKHSPFLLALMPSFLAPLFGTSYNMIWQLFCYGSLLYFGHSLASAPWFAYEQASLRYQTFKWTKNAIAAEQQRSQMQRHLFLSCFLPVLLGCSIFYLQIQYPNTLLDLFQVPVYWVAVLWRPIQRLWTWFVTDEFTLDDGPNQKEKPSDEMDVLLRKSRLFQNLQRKLDQILEQLERRGHETPLRNDDASLVTRETLAACLAPLVEDIEKLTMAEQRQFRQNKSSLGWMILHWLVTCFLWPLWMVQWGGRLGWQWVSGHWKAALT